MIVLSGASLVLPDRVLSPGTLVIDEGRIAEIRSDAPSGNHAAFAFHGHYIVPGFIDVHVHGVDGVDALDTAPADGAVAAIAARLPRYGVTAFCPTTVACGPAALRRVLDQVRRARETPVIRSARVLPAHLESNFINPDYTGAQPSGCLRSPRGILAAGQAGSVAGGRGVREAGEDFAAADILAEIERATPDVGIVTLASELDGGLDLVRWLSARGHQVSLGHSGATYEEALAAISAGARQATHLFNRMPRLDHRAPGLVGAVLQSDETAAEIICDGVHVHPALIRMTIAAKRPSRILAITDGTAAAGLPVGSQAMLGGQPITAGERTAELRDGTIAGSVLTMDRAFQTLVAQVGLSVVDAATICSTSPARELGLIGHGMLMPDAVADLVILDPQFSVVQTYLAGQLVYARGAGAQSSPSDAGGLRLH
jgi:N-acetylglucosamine-6-phosphate deacetylase